MGNEQTKSDAPVRVLLVDDSPTNLRLTGGVLRRLGCEVSTAESGEFALEAAQSEPPFHLVLLDYQMPGMDGPTTARKLIEVWGEPTPPIIALTGEVDPAVYRSCRDAGMRLVLRKPVERAHLGAIVERIRELEGQRA